MDKYPKLTNAQVAEKDFNNNGNDLLALHLLKNLCFNEVTGVLAGGASDSTTSEAVFVAPTKLQVVSVKFIRTAMNTGEDNTPEVELVQGANTIVAQEIIPLAGAVGDVTPVPLVPDHVVVPEGTVLKLVIITPVSTVTTALKGKLQIEWNPVV